MTGVCTVYNTPGQRNTLTPVWNEEFQIPVIVMSLRILTVQLLDVQTGKVLGVAYIRDVPAEGVDDS
jgi:Ca2+-dependent lipid-binding protein